MEVSIKTIVTHSVTYMIMGLLASTLLNYAGFFSESSLKVMMRPLDDPWVMAGPLFQPLRGILFGIGFYLLRDLFFTDQKGWWKMWLVLMIFGIFGTFGPAPGSLEGMVYTIFPLWIHLKGLPEIILQSLGLSVVLCWWIHHSQIKWFNRMMGILFVILMLLPVLGFLAGPVK